MATLFLSCVLHCCTRVMAPTARWSQQDGAALQSAKTQCRNEDKCLVTFKKVEESIYTAVCGQDNN